MKYLLILTTEAEWAFDIEAETYPNIRWIAHNSAYESWWLVTAERYTEVNQLQASISKAAGGDNQIEVIQVTEIGKISIANGDTIQILRYHFLEYGIKMIDPSDDGTAFRNRISEKVDEAQWFVSDQFDGFMIGKSADLEPLRIILKNDPQIINLKLTATRDSMKVIYLKKD